MVEFSCQSVHRLAKLAHRAGCFWRSVGLSRQLVFVPFTFGLLSTPKEETIAVEKVCSKQSHSSKFVDSLNSGVCFWILSMVSMPAFLRWHLFLDRKSVV